MKDYSYIILKLFENFSDSELYLKSVLALKAATSCLPRSVLEDSVDMRLIYKKPVYILKAWFLKTAIIGQFGSTECWLFVPLCQVENES